MEVRKKCWQGKEEEGEGEMRKNGKVKKAMKGSFISPFVVAVEHIIHPVAS